MVIILSCSLIVPAQTTATPRPLKMVPIQPLPGAVSPKEL